MKKGQAALEFLTTYGWAFLVILIMMAALGYFGFYNPSKVLPNKCLFGSEFACQDHQINDQQEVKFKLTQSVEKNIEAGQTTCTVEGTTLSKIATMSPAAPSWSNRGYKEFICTFDPDTFVQDERVKILITVEYQLKPGGYIHETDGEIFSKVVD